MPSRVNDTKVVWMYFPNQRLQIQFRFDPTKHYRKSYQHAIVLTTYSPCLQVYKTQDDALLTGLSRMVGSSEVILSPLNLRTSLNPSLYFIVFVYDFTIILFLLGSNPICTLTLTVHTMGVSFLTAYA